jgi:hypothetical protein
MLNVGRGRRHANRSADPPAAARCGRRAVQERKDTGMTRIVTRLPNQSEGRSKIRQELLDAGIALREQTIAAAARRRERRPDTEVADYAFERRPRRPRPRRTGRARSPFSSCANRCYAARVVTRISPAGCGRPTSLLPACPTWRAQASRGASTLRPPLRRRSTNSRHVGPSWPRYCTRWARGAASRHRSPPVTPGHRCSTEAGPAHRRRLGRDPQASTDPSPQP